MNRDPCNRDSSEKPRRIDRDYFAQCAKATKGSSLHTEANALATKGLERIARAWPFFLARYCPKKVKIYFGL